MTTSQTKEVSKGNEVISCVSCPLRKYDLCKALIGEPAKKDRMAARQPGKMTARRRMHRISGKISDIKIVRTGWLASVIQHPNGGQVFARVILPGDLIGGSVLLTGRSLNDVVALTDVEYCSFEKESFVSFVREDKNFREVLSFYSENSFQIFQDHFFDISSYEADERILRFFLRVYDKAENVGLAKNGVMFFPMRQHHIAGALALTPIHVNRVLQKLKRDDVITLEKQTLSFVRLQEVREMLA